jgi:hypothetical protein
MAVNDENKKKAVKVERFSVFSQLDSLGNTA